MPERSFYHCLDWGVFLGGVTTSKEFVSLLEESIATVVVEHWILSFVSPQEYESIKCHFYFNNKTFVLQQGGVRELLVRLELLVSENKYRGTLTLFRRQR
ncbi:hypothetical protein TNCT_456961 [Trichonephila clavata]|uniref:Uncharacterized protein n=1 Tax=Trichonephila clavata TaxID=2740835 RepID=A0A8X6G382_TRICU|nr:hypothetical protein TNCT_456961 [Trichonephila clavata]